MSTPEPRNGAAAVVFGAILLVASVTLIRVGPPQWFFLDEWDFLAHRTAWDTRDLLHPHNEHWSAVPILLYRGAYRLFGIMDYRPYRAMVLGTHLLSATLMRLVLRRAGLGPWLATAVVLPWIFFGSGWENIVWGFQVTWNGAIALSLIQLLLADHDGPRGRRDALALAAGVTALLFAGVAVAMTAAMGCCLLLRRGWRVAAFHVLPVAATYLTWSLFYGEAAWLEYDHPDKMLRFMWSGLASTTTAWAWWGGPAIVLALAVVAGWVVGWRATPRSERGDRFGIPVGFAFGTTVYLFTVALNRAWLGPAAARSPRYLYVLALLLLPVIGRGIASLIDRLGGRPAARGWRRPMVAVGAVALVWVGVPGNVGELSRSTLSRRVQSGDRAVLQAHAFVALERPELPDAGHPLPDEAPQVSIGWLRDAVADGYLDPVDPAAFGYEARVADSMLLVGVERPVDASGCPVLVDGETRHLEPGEQLTFGGFLIEAVATTVDGHTVRRHFTGAYGQAMEATAPLDLVLRNPFPGLAVRLC